jgi:acyl-CoA synthetase (AMP-forming)/AMP-acid ligase II
MKVRGFQVAPAELEGCLYDHPDVADACVVGIPHQFSGEVPLAFVVLNPRAAKRLNDAPHLADEIKAGIIQVNTLSTCLTLHQRLIICPVSMSRPTRSLTNILREALSSWTQSRRILAVNC